MFTNRKLQMFNNNHGWMAAFDDYTSKSWEENIFTRVEIVYGKTIHIIEL